MAIIARRGLDREIALVAVGLELLDVEYGAMRELLREEILVELGEDGAGALIGVREKRGSQDLPGRRRFEWRDVIIDIQGLFRIIDQLPTPCLLTGAAGDQRESARRKA